MGEKDWISVINGNSLAVALKAANEYTVKFGLTLSEEETALLVNAQRETLMKERRVEFGEGILPKLIFAFCDSPYIYQDNYVETLERLQEIFYFYKNESMDEYTDDELVDAMKKLFDGPCQGSLDFMEDTGLEKLARIARNNQCFDEEEEDEL